MQHDAHRAPDGRPLRICHLATGPLNGGAARGALWLHEGLSDLGCESTLITDYRGRRASRDVLELPTFVHPKISRYVRTACEQLPLTLYRGRSRALFSTGLAGRAVTRIPAVDSADIVHLHWINGGLVSTRSLAQLDVPVVWTLRDLWPATGGCHHPGVTGCRNFESGCGHCPHLGSRSRWDLSRLLYRHKSRSLPRNLTIVGISEWVASEARRSPLFNGKPILAIPNCIDTDLFAPVDRGGARHILGLSQELPLVLIGALSPTDPFKGWPEVMAALGNVRSRFGTLVFGDISTAAVATIPRLVRDFGFVSDDLKLRLIYSAADVFVSGSTCDAFGKTIAESLACGTPAVVFGATGPKEIVSHMESGYLAEPFEPASLATGIDWVLGHPHPNQLSRSARDRAVGSFSKSRAAQSYLALYRQLCPGVA
jgi:glycosyltransferase involved in cell wall biosynthesis